MQKLSLSIKLFTAVSDRFQTSERMCGNQRLEFADLSNRVVSLSIKGKAFRLGY